MSGAAGLDVRYPIGGLFVVIGLLLAGYGVSTMGDADLYARTGGLNLNLAWGSIMTAFGALCLVLAVRADRRAAGG